MSAIVERFSDVIVPVTDGLAVAFLFVLGANLGSFLNVLAHRLPRGLSVVRGGSRCPACGAAIRWHDNVPVVGWLALGGRCRDCRVGIPSRYPLVEAACAVLVGGVASVELLTGGATLPGARFGSRRWGADVLLLRTDWLLVAVSALHCWLLVTLLAWGLLRLDGRGVPGRWLVATVLGALVAVAIMPGLNPGAIDPMRAAVGGLALAAVLGAARAAVAGRDEGIVLASALGAVGSAVGGWGVMSIAVLTTLVAASRIVLHQLLHQVVTPREVAPVRPRGNWLLLDLTVAVAVHLLLWRWISGWCQVAMPALLAGLRHPA